jgi:hypothetical protein
VPLNDVAAVVASPDYPDGNEVSFVAAIEPADAT